MKASQRSLASFSEALAGRSFIENNQNNQRNQIAPAFLYTIESVRVLAILEELNWVIL
jgi:hypothetical protein